MSRNVERARVALLHSQLRWLMQLRWVAGVLIVLAGLVNWAWLGLYGGTLAPVGAGLMLAAVNTGLVWFDARPARLHERLSFLETTATAHLTIDVAFLLYLTLCTGGAGSPLIGFFMFHMVFASLLQSRARAYITGMVTICAVAAGLWSTGQWPRDTSTALGAAGWGVTLLVTVYLSNRLTGALYRRELVRERQNRRLRRLMEKLRTQQDVMVQQDKMAAMGQLAAGVAHEITNPLASMDSVLQLIQRNPSSPRPEMVAALREQVERIHRTVRQLTAFAHPGEKRSEQVAVNDVVRSAMEMLAYDRRLKKVAVVVELDESAGVARLNPHATGQVLANLLRNAVDAMEDSPRQKLAVRTRREGGECVIEIADSGCGISKENQRRIFEPFFTTKAVGKGTGLGLSISVKLMREQGGWIGVSSQEGEGTVFTVHVPCAEREENSARSLERAAS